MISRHRRTGGGLSLLFFVGCFLAGAAGALATSTTGIPPLPESAGKGQSAAQQAILFVLEGVGQDSLKAASMPVLSRLIKTGAVTWGASAVNPPLRLPTMASLITGLPVERHGITWNSFDFARGYPRPPTMFDYLDLSGGRDTTIFYMDESLYQLAKPEPYIDHQICGALRPECNATTVVSYIRQYFKKAISGHGYGHAIPSLPHLLIVHLPDAGRAGAAEGWTSKSYREALNTIDRAMGDVLAIYDELGLSKETTVFVTSISPPGADHFGDAEPAAAPAGAPWWGTGMAMARPPSASSIQAPAPGTCGTARTSVALTSPPSSMAAQAGPQWRATGMATGRAQLAPPIPVAPGTCATPTAAVPRTSRPSATAERARHR